MCKCTVLWGCEKQINGVLPLRSLIVRQKRRKWSMMRWATKGCCMCIDCGWSSLESFLLISLFILSKEHLYCFGKWVFLLHLLVQLHQNQITLCTFVSVRRSDTRYFNFFFFISMVCVRRHRELNDAIKGKQWLMLLKLWLLSKIWCHHFFKLLSPRLAVVYSDDDLHLKTCGGTITRELI